MGFRVFNRQPKPRRIIVTWHEPAADWFGPPPDWPWPPRWVPPEAQTEAEVVALPDAQPEPEEVAA